MSQSNSAPVKRLPAPLAEMLKTAGERAGDPQAAFLRDFAGEPPLSQQASPAPVPVAPAQQAVEPPAAIGPTPEAPAPMMDLDGSDDAEQRGWSKKTYRLRPDQYEKLALLQAQILGKRHARVGASELAREAFDLLFHRYAKMLADRERKSRSQEA